MTPPDLRQAQKIGRRASALSRDRGLAVGKVRDPRFGEVNTYHESVLRDILQPIS